MGKDDTEPDGLKGESNEHRDAWKAFEESGKTPYKEGDPMPKGWEVPDDD